MLTNSFVKEVHYLLKAGPVFLLNSGDYGDEDAGICSPRSGAQASTWNLSSTHSPDPPPPPQNSPRPPPSAQNSLRNTFFPQHNLQTHDFCF